MEKSKQYSTFFSSRTAGFMNQLSREYVRKAGQKVLFYKLDVEKTDFTDEFERIHREVSNKKYHPPQEIECKVYIDPKSTENFRDVAYELRTYINVFIEREYLKDLGIEPMIGDRVSFQNQLFEVYDTDDSLMYHGNPLFQYSVKVDCVDIRLNNNEDPLKTDIEYYEDDLNRNEERELPEIPTDFTSILLDSRLILDENSSVETNYTNDFNVLNASIKLKVESSENDPVVSQHTDGLFVVFNNKKDTIFFESNDSPLTNTVSTQIVNENSEFYLQIDLSFHVKHPDFSKVDELADVLNKEINDGIFVFVS